MPTRSIALRLNLASPEHRASLWTTHRLVNERTRWFVEHLLILRGDVVWTGDAALARALGHPGVETNRHRLFEVSAEMVQTRLREHLALLAPGLTGSTLDEAMQDLGKLYDLIVPTHADPDNKADSASLAKQWLKPLVDRTSNAFETEQSLSVKPEWLTEKEDGQEWEPSARAWLQRILRAFKEKRYADEGITAGYSKAAWYKVANGGGELDKWVPLFEKAVADAQKSPIGPVVNRLRTQGLLDCLRTYQGFNHILGESGSLEMSKWDYLVLTRVIARLLSWESWNHRARKEHEKRAAEFAAIEATLAPYAPYKALLKGYEQERTKELRATNQLAKEDTDFRIGGRQIRKWEALARELQQAPVGADLPQIAADFQTKNPKESPDPYFTDWVLSDDARKGLWFTDEGVKAVQLLAKANRLEQKKNKSRERTAMTPPHPRLHPVWLQFEEPSGGNLKNLDLEQFPEGGWAAVFDLISPQDGGGYEEHKFRIAICPSPQLALQNLEKRDKTTGEPGKTPVLTFVQAPSFSRVKDRGEWETWVGTMQSPDILLDRAFLEKVPGQPNGREYLRSHPDTPLAPKLLRADLKLVLDLEPNLVEGQGIAQKVNGKFRWSDAPRWAYHLQTSLSESSKYEDALAEGQRFFSVDLGVRDLAAVALFEIQRGAIAAGEQAFPIPASSPWKAVLVPESQATLSLPGELATLEDAGGDDIERRRRETKETLNLLKFLKSRRTLLLRLAHPKTEAKSRKKALEALQRKPKDPEAKARLVEDQDRHARSLSTLLADDAPPSAKGDRASGKKQETKASNVESRFHPALRQAAALDPLPDGLEKHPVAQATLDAWDQAIADLIRVWRDRTRRRDPRRAGLHGKSLWAIEHLSEVRDFLKGWHRRGSESGEVNRPGPDFAKALLDHINQLKEDRTKEGANLLVNTARGLRYDETTHRWEPRFPPAHLILFEDLARYRFFTDRTRSENSQLMRWSHRELTKVTAQMAELFGIGTLDTGAGFTSRYHGWSGAPGVRCSTFTAEDIASDWFKRRWEAAKHGWQPVAGLPVPWEGGKRFFTLDGSGRLVEEDADHNAAISLARRFALRNGEAVRLVCMGKDDDSFVPDALGKRLLGALRNPNNPKDKGYGRLVPVPGGQAYAWESLSQAAWEKASGKKGAKEDPEDTAPEDDADALDAAQEAAEAESGKVEDARTGKKITFFRDPSGVFFEASHWVPGDHFWHKVRQDLLKALRARPSEAIPF